MRSLLASLVLLLAAGVADAAVVSVPCTESGIDTIVASLKGGDILELAAGDCTWTGQHIWDLSALTGPIWIRGQGDATIIRDDATTPATDDAIAIILTSQAMCLRVSHLKFTSSAGSSPRGNVLTIRGAFGVAGSSCVRVDHLTLDNVSTHNADILNFYNVMGVVDNVTYANTIESTILASVNFNAQMPGEPSAPTQTDTNGNWGNSGWAAATYAGSAKAMYFEDITVNYTAGAAGTQPHVSMNTHYASRWVFRFSDLTRTHFTLHAVETAGRRGSGRWFEIYRNALSWGNVADGPLINVGAGTGVIWNNVITSGVNTVTTLASAALQDREQRDTGNFGRCNGLQPYDTNATTGTLGGSLYVRGQHNGASNVNAMTDTTKSWSAGTSEDGSSNGQWGGNLGGKFYVILNYRTDSTYTTPGCPTCYHVTIDSNTATRIDYTLTNIKDNQTPTAGSGAAAIDWDTNDYYEIRKVVQCMDEPGTGQSAVIYDSRTVTNPPTPASPSNNLPEPIRVYGNTRDGSAFSVTTPYTHYTAAYLTTADPGYTAYTYRCPTGGCTATGKQTCDNPKGCGHPLRWTNSRLNVPTRLGEGAGGVVSRPGVTDASRAAVGANRPNSE